MYEAISSAIAKWLTPSSLFIFLNLVIVTIFIISRFIAPKTQIHHPPQFLRSTSLLDRVRSFNYQYSPAVEQTESTHPQLVRVPSLLERVKSFDFNLYKYQQPHPQTEHVQTEPEHRTQDLDSNLTNLQEPQLTRAPSFLQRLQSIKVSRLYKSESIHGEKESEPETVEQWMPATARREKTRLREEEEGVDAKADDFIKRFKKQLRLQRVDSFLRYRDMLE
ncbi:hypothetical protein TanjilG_26094 [Lupinus angustifolius]|uniref:DUF4408 domain-containing protein n=1 Tax=Lupinus angustifolius TaxID=3871 RepID=A0A4P1R1X0_LUPAN|nr:hypothetical protein TanjilG_26094 [Lupinus angustifolius]